MEDNQVLKHIEKLVADEEHLYSKGNLTDEEIKHLHKLKVELDQYWDFLRQRRSLRDAGENPADAKIRPAKTVENYKQ
jgi:flagellar biosynthesis/type III secretory pathway chaperone